MSTQPLPPIRKWPAARPVAAVHIIHGLAEHPERYDEFAKALNDANITVWAHHQRGHGDNPEPGTQGHFADDDGWRALIDDAWAVSKALKDETRVPLMMFAHSMGSFVGQGVLAEHGNDYSAVVFSGTNGPPSPVEQQGQTIAVWQLRVLGPRQPGLWLFHIVFDTFSAPYGPDAPPNTWLSRDAEEVKKYNCDKKCGFPLSAKAWLDLADGRAAQASVEFFKRYPRDLPIHIIAGTADPVGELGAGVRRLLATLKKARLTRVTSEFYKDARHEPLHETNRDVVAADVVRWFLANGVTRALRSAPPVPINTSVALRDVRASFDRVMTREPVDVSVAGNPGLETTFSHVQGAVKQGDLYLLTHSNRGGDPALLVCNDTTLVKTIPLCQPPGSARLFDHAGGLQRLGDYAVIPLEPMDGMPASRVAFFDITDPVSTHEMPSPPAITRDDRKASTAGIASVMVGGRMRWYVATLDDHQVDVYGSTVGEFPDTTFEHLFCDTLDLGGHQSFCLVAEEGGALYAIGLRSTGAMLRDFADLYAIDVDAGKVRFVETRQFTTKAIYNVHFRWGAGLDVGESEGLRVLATGRNFTIFSLAQAGAEVAVPEEIQRAEMAMGHHCHLETFHDPLE